ncbi:hypothetical protein HaLaN_29463 [Haematococcus lacustris]|uniref:Uncharacterized protein n=1 Tax=Haematococcus lacustris TaxID=44745 RepID=A0A6A0AE84_HAELA|nr:hypothetical protein HaLaN_29463 [Haematococcus lacustris]
MAAGWAGIRRGSGSGGRGAAFCARGGCTAGGVGALRNPGAGVDAYPNLRGHKQCGDTNSEGAVKAGARALQQPPKGQYSAVQWLVMCTSQEPLYAFVPMLAMSITAYQLVSLASPALGRAQPAGLPASGVQPASLPGPWAFGLFSTEAVLGEFLCLVLLIALAVQRVGAQSDDLVDQQGVTFPCTWHGRLPPTTYTIV